MLPQSWVGKSIGERYRVEALLGQGGMSAVYRATDPNLRRQVAIKLIHYHLSVDPRFVDRFKEEAAAVARLRHPNIVQVHDFNVDDQAYYMVMEYLVGETLQARLKRLGETQRRMPLPEAIHICGQLCDALGYAHDHDLVHRDVKPANIMLDVNGQAILMDFGIVKIIGGEYHTATGATVGTAMYMSPEQIRSERADERSDIYSLGVTLYEMIGGRVPYRADSALSLMMMALNDPLPDLREMREGLSESLLAVVEKALAKEKADRFQSMAEMAAALREVPEPKDRSAAVTVVDKEQPGAPGPLPSPMDGPEQAPVAPAGKEKSVTIAGGEPVVDAHEPRSAGEEPGISAIPTLVDPSPFPSQAVTPTRDKGRAWPDYRRFIVAGAILLLVSAVGLGIYFQSRKAPSLQLGRIDRPPAPIHIQTAQAVVSLARWETGAPIEALAYAPNGALIATANNRESARFSKYRFYGSLWRVESGTLQSYLLGHSAWVYGVAFSPDGQLLATASDDDSLIIWGASDGGLVRTIEASLGGIADVEFSPSNLLLAAGSWGGRVALWQVSDGHLLRTLEGHGDSVRGIAFSPDGTTLASASDDLTIRLWKVSDGRAIHTLRGHTAPIREVAFSPDGMLLASASEDRTIRLWQSSEGRLVRTLQGHSEPVLDVAFAADGSLLASASGDGTVRFWRVADGDLVRILAEHAESVTSLAFSPDNHILISGATDGVLQFWGLSEAIPLEPEDVG